MQIGQLKKGNFASLCSLKGFFQGEVTKDKSSNTVLSTKKAVDWIETSYDPARQNIFQHGADQNPLFDRLHIFGLHPKNLHK